MNSDTFKSLLRFIKPSRWNYKGGQTEVSGSKMLAMTLNYLDSQMMVRHLARQFGVTTDTFIRLTETVMKLHMGIADHAIKWPSKDEYPDIAAKFNKRRQR